MMIGVLLQGSGSGYITFFLLLNTMLVSLNLLIRIPIYFFSILFVFQLIQQYKYFAKISTGYVSGMIETFGLQIDQWIISVNEYHPILSTLLGGVSSEIDFGPLYLMSNVGLIYSLLFLIFIVISALKSKNRHEKTAFLILLVGNLHYPVMFYSIMVFVLPLFLQKIIFTVEDKTTFSRVGIS
jgi:hypothetical protein